MEEKERKEKLKAGKEKLAQFQKRKKKKKQKLDHVEETFRGPGLAGGDVLGYTVPSGADFVYDSDSQSVSSCSEEDSEQNEETTGTEFLKIRAELQRKCDRIEELEELLVGKQLALDKVLKENMELQEHPASQEKNMSEGGDHIKDQTEVKTDGYQEHTTSTGDGLSQIDVEAVRDLIQQVQWLQLQLKQAGNTLQSQNEKQGVTLVALQKAKSEIQDLQENITQKDSVVTDLVEKLKTVSLECSQLREAHRKQLNMVEQSGIEIHHDYQKKIKDLEHENEVLEKKVQQLDDQEKFSMKEKENLIQEISSLKGRLEIVEKSHEHSITDYKVQIESLNVENTVLLKDKENLIEVENKQKNELRSFCQQLEVLKTEKVNSDQQLAGLLSENEKLIEENELVSHQVVVLKEDNSMYKSQISNYEDKISQAEEVADENHSLRLQNDDLNNKINNQKDTIASLRSNIAAVTSENTELTNQVKNISVTLTEQNSELEILKTELDKLVLLSEERKSAAEEIQSECDQYKTLNNSLEEEVLLLKQDLHNAVNECETLKLEKSHLHEQLHQNSTEKEVHVGHAISEMIVPQVQEVMHVQCAKSLEIEPDVDNVVEDPMIASTITYVQASPNVPNTENGDLSGADENLSLKQKVVLLEAEVEELRTEVLHLRASDIVTGVMLTAQKVVSNNGNKTNVPSAGEEKVKTDVYESTVDIVNDTAYQTLSLCQNSVVNETNAIDELPYLHHENTESMQDMLQCKLEENDMPTTTLNNLQADVQKLTKHDQTLTSSAKDSIAEPGKDLSRQEDPEVSHLNLYRVDTLELEVNMHASSYPSTQRDDPRLPHSYTLGNVDIQFQQAGVDRENNEGVVNESDVNMVEEHAVNTGTLSSRHQKESAYLNNIVKQLQQEKIEIFEVCKKEKLDKEKIVDELENVNKRNIILNSELTDFKNFLSKSKSENKEMQEVLQEEKSKNDELISQNEKILWERNELEIRLNDLEIEFSSMKSMKCDLQYKEEEVREELERVKERLEYLESSEKDIFEMKEMTEKLQEEKDIILKENETLHCSLAVKVNENDRIVEILDSVRKEKAELIATSQTCLQENTNLMKQLSECKVIKEQLENNFTEVVRNNKELESRYVGEIEGLVEENSTLKTKLHTNEEEMEVLKSEIRRLNDIFSSIDEQLQETSVIKQRNSELEIKFEDISKENEDLVNELLSFQQKVDGLQRENETFVVKCDELQNIIDDMDEEKTSLLESVETLKCESDSKVREKEIIIDKYEMQLDGLDNENATLKTQVLSLKQDLHEIIEQSQTLDEDYSKQTDTLSKLNLEKQALEEEAAANQSKVIQMEQDLLELVNQVQLYDNTLSEKVDLATRLDEQVNSLLRENTELSEKCGSLEHDLADFKTKESYLTEQLKIYEASVTKNENSFDELARLNSQLELEIKYKVKAQNDVEKLNSEMIKLVSEKEELKSDNEIIRKGFDELLATRDYEKKLLEKLKEEMKTIECERDEIILEYQSLSDNMNEVVSENEALSLEVDKLNRNLVSVSENRNHIRTQVEILAAEIESLVIERERYVSENNKLESDRKILTLKDKKLQETYLHLCEQNEFLIKQCEELDNQNKKLQNQNDEIRLQTIAFQEKLTKLDDHLKNSVSAQGENVALGKKVDDLIYHVETLQREKKRLESVVEDLTSMLHDMQTKYEEVKSEMESTKKKCDKEISQLQSHLQVMNEDVTELRKVLDVMESEMYNVSEEKEVLKENYEQQQTQLIEAVEAKEMLLQKLSDKQQKDLQNMRMVNKLYQEKSDHPHCVESIAADEMNFQGECQTEIASQMNTEECAQQDLPLFEAMLQYFPDNDQTQKVTNAHVQTNISIGEFESAGVLVDDNGENNEIIKDNLTNCGTQTFWEVEQWQNVDFEVCDRNLDRKSETSQIKVGSKSIDNRNDRPEKTDQISQTDLYEPDSVNHYICTKGEGLSISVSSQCDILRSDYALDIDQLNQYVQTIPERERSVSYTDNMSEVPENSPLLSASMIQQRKVSSETDSFDSHEKVLDCVQENLEVSNNDVSCQTNTDFQSEFKVEILSAVQAMTEGLESRENNVKRLEDNYERKLRQAEYELEEKYEQKFRNREAEISLEAEKDKKKHASEVELEARRTIEKVKVEKDQQFVVALQQVRADMARKNKGRKGSAKRAASHETPRDAADSGLVSDASEKVPSQDLHQLQQDNQELAQARDDLLQKINVTQLEQEVFRDELYCIMGEHSMLGETQQSANQQASQMAPSFLDWELSPELSFDSVRSSIDTKSLSGSLDTSLFCSNTDCLSVRMKYEHLIEKIHQFLKIKSTQREQTVAHPGNPSLDTGYSEEENDIVFARKTELTGNEPVEISSVEDKFIEHSESDDQMLQRVTSIHLEHWAKGVKTHESNENEVKDTFIVEQVDKACHDRANVDSIITELVTESQVKPLNARDPETPSRKRISRKKVRGGFTLTSTPSDTDRSPEGINDANVSPFSHCTASVATMEEGHFSEDDIDEEFYTSTSRKRHFSDGDIKIDPDMWLDKSGQGDNTEGHFVSERIQVHSMSEPREIFQKKDRGDTDSSEHEYKKNVEDKEAKLKLKLQLSKMVKIDGENKFVAEHINDNKESFAGQTFSVAHMADTGPLSGKDSGDFFEESLTDNNDTDERVDSGDILEKISHQLPEQSTNALIHEKEDNTTDEPFEKGGVFHADAVTPKIEADFIQETVVECSVSASGSGEKARSVHGILEGNKQEYENTLFDMLNSICPGTDPSRHPDHRNDRDEGEAMSKTSFLKDLSVPAKSKQEVLEEKITELETSVLALEHEKHKAEENLRKDRAEKLDTIDSLNYEIAMLKETLNEKSQDLNTALKKYEDLKSENTRLSDVVRLQQIPEAADSQDHLVSHIQELENETKQLKESNIQLLSSNEMYESNYAALESQNNTLIEKLHQIDNAVSERDEFMSNLVAEMNVLKEENNKLEILLASQKEVRTELEQLTTEKERLLYELEREYSERSSILEEKSELENKLIKQTDMFDELRNKNTALQQELTEIENDKKEHIQLIQMENRELNFNLKTEKDQLADLQKRYSAMKTLVTDKEKEISELHKALRIQDEHLEERNLKLQQVQGKNETLKQNKSELETLLFDMRESVKDKEISFDKILQEKEMLETRVQICNEKNEMLSKEVTSQQAQVFQVKVDNDNLRIRNEELLTDNKKISQDLESSAELKNEHEWAIKELAIQLESLEKENKVYSKTIEELKNKLVIADKEENICPETEDIHIFPNKNDSKNKHDHTDSRLDNSDSKSDRSDTDQQILEDLKETLKLLQDEKVSMERQNKEEKALLQEENKMLIDELCQLKEEKAKHEKMLKCQEDSLRKENAEILKMYSDLRNEVEVLVISKHDLEIELVALKNLLEHGDPSLVKLPKESGRELTLKDLEDLDELKSSIEQLKSEMKEKDDYVRKLEEHLLNADRGLPSGTSTPKPLTSQGEPMLSKAFKHKKLIQIGKRAFSHDVPIISVKDEIENFDHAGALNEAVQQTEGSVHESDLNQSDISERHFNNRLNEGANVFTSSQQSDGRSVSSVSDSFDSSRIRSGLNPEEDGHLALELKQFELVDEISKLKRDFRETKAIYAQETALLSQALEKEKVQKEFLQSGRGRTSSDPSWNQNIKLDINNDIVKLRQDLAVIHEENKLLKIENERWISKIKEQEKIVVDLKDRLYRNTSGIEEIEEVFGRQLALLQKQREELLDKLKDREDENYKLSAILGDKGVLEESLRREKDILLAKLREKSGLENELVEKKQTLAILETKQKEMEDVIFQKDLNERELMKQKRLLEEELHEIEAKFKDREENLGFEKNQLLDELRVKKETSLCVSESDIDDRSVCSDSSSFSDRHINNLELTLQDVEKQHAEAVRVLREQLKHKYRRREKALRQDHKAGLERLQTNTDKQLETLRSQYESQLEGLRSEMEGRGGPGSDDDSNGGGTGGLRERYQEVTDELGKSLPNDQKEKLDTLMADMDKNYQQQIDSMHQQHVNGVDEQVKAMRSTLEEIYNGQLDLAKSELEQTHQVALAELQEKLDKEHKEEVNKIVQEWQTKMDDLQQDYEREIRDSKLSQSIGRY